MDRMSGSGAMTEVISSLLGVLGIELAPWMAPLAALLLMIVLLPLILANMKTSRARKLLKRAHLLNGVEGRALEEEALRLVSSRPMGLVAIADEAIRHGRYGLARDAVARLRETGAQRAHLRRLTEAVDPTPLPPSVNETLLLIERLDQSGLRDEAERRWLAARRRWPRESLFMTPPWHEGEAGQQPSSSSEPPR